MKLKNFIIVALLGVVSFVLSMVGGLVTQLFGTYGMFIHVSIGSLLCGPIFYVMCQKVSKRGTVFIYYLIMGLIYTIMGFLPMLIIMIAAGIIGELLIGNVNNYKSNGKITLSYIVSQVIYALHGFFFILVLGIQGLVNTFPNLFTMEKAQMVHDIFFNPKTILIILVIEIIAAYFGALLGKYINNKFFSENGKESILS